MKITKRELINWTAEQQKKSWEQPTTFEKRLGTYEHCKEICKKSGYVSGAFDQIWNAAIRQRAIADGCYRG